MQYLKKSLMARLIFYFLLLSLLTVGLSGSIAFFRARRALQASAFDRLYVAAALKEDALNQWVDYQIQDLLLMTQLPAIQSATGTLLEQDDAETAYQQAYAATQETLVRVGSKKAAWQEILLLSDKGKVLVSTDASHEGDYRTMDPYYTQGRQETYLQKVYPAPADYKPTMTISTPLLDATDQRLGVLAVHLNLGIMDRIILERTGLGTRSESYLVDRFNAFISGDRYGRDEFPLGIHSTGIDAALEGINGSGLYRNYRKVPVLGVYRWIADLEMALLTEIPQEAAFAPAQRLAGLVLLVGLVIALFLTMGIYVLARQIAGPILGITEAALRVADGDLTSTAPVATQDEIGVLAHTFNDMTGRLRTLYDDLREEIAERKRVAAEREQLIVELETKNAQLERFTYTVSHDLKSPLVTIKGFLGLLEKDALAGDIPRMQGDMRAISSAAETMQQLLDELLDLSRIGRTANAPETVSLNDLAEEAVRLVAGRIAQRGVEVAVEPDMPAVFGDRVRLLEVMQNLVDNAAKFMDEQPAPRIEIGACEEGTMARCYVRDNGAGIAPRYHENVFGLFNRLHAEAEGTGIGLALAKRIVEVHGGRIWVDSEGEGYGSTFCFTLPRP